MGVGGETSTQIKARLLAASALLSRPTIIWAGRNNFTSASAVKSDIAAMVAALGHTNYLVLSVLNSDTANEYSGQSNYNTIIQLNADLATTYGSRFIDIRSHLVSLYDPGTSQDVTDHGRDIPPSTLRSDTLHLNNAGYQAVANKVYESISILNP